MFDIGFHETLIIMATAVVVIGPQNIPKRVQWMKRNFRKLQAHSFLDWLYYAVLILIALVVLANNPFIW